MKISKVSIVDTASGTA